MKREAYVIAVVHAGVQTLSWSFERFIFALDIKNLGFHFVYYEEGTSSVKPFEEIRFGETNGIISRFLLVAVEDSIPSRTGAENRDNETRTVHIGMYSILDGLYRCQGEWSAVIGRVFFAASLFNTWYFTERHTRAEIVIWCVRCI